MSGGFATMTRVPRISEFYGIVIEMYFVDHPPPHFHARYSGDEALIVIESGEVFAGECTRLIDRRQRLLSALVASVHGRIRDAWL